MRYFAFLLLLLAGPVELKAGSASTNLAAFGFLGPETYPIDNFISNLRSADLDDDGLQRCRVDGGEHAREL